MKKLIAFFLAAVMLCGIVSASAEGESLEALQRIYDRQHSIVSSGGDGGQYVAAIRADGTVMVRWDGMDVSYWQDIVSLAAGSHRLVGLRADGRVVTASRFTHQYNFLSAPYLDVSDWEEIVAISASGDTVVGLRADGTVAAAGSNEFGQCDVEDLTGIVAIAAGDGFTAAVREDGTVALVGIAPGTFAMYHGSDLVDETYGDVSSWTDITALAAGYPYLFGLRKDGTVVKTLCFHPQEWDAYLLNSYAEMDFDVSGSWGDVVSISACGPSLMGLTKDGKILSSGFLSYVWGAEHEQTAQAIAYGGFYGFFQDTDGILQTLGYTYNPDMGEPTLCRPALEPIVFDFSRTYDSTVAITITEENWDNYLEYVCERSVRTDENGSYLDLVSSYRLIPEYAALLDPGRISSVSLSVDYTSSSATFRLYPDSPTDSSTQSVLSSTPCHADLTLSFPEAESAVLERNSITRFDDSGIGSQVDHPTVTAAEGTIYLRLF